MGLCSQRVRRRTSDAQQAGRNPTRGIHGPLRGSSEMFWGVGAGSGQQMQIF